MHISGRATSGDVWKRDVCVLRGNRKVPGEVLLPECCVGWGWEPWPGSPGSGSVSGPGVGMAYLAGEGFGKRLPIRAERARSVVQQ